MASDKQIRANRLNAQRSTGPRTAHGKSVSRRNALSHGLTAKHVLVPGESPDDFAALRDGIWQEYDPQGTMELEFAEHLASLLWRLRRVPVFESALMYWMNRYSVCIYDGDETALVGTMTSPEAIQDLDPEADADDVALHDNFVLGRTLAHMISKGDLFSKIAQYEANLVRQMERTLARLEALIAQRHEIERRNATSDASSKAA